MVPAVRSARPRLKSRTGLAAIAAGAAVLMGAGPAGALSSQQQGFLSLAEQGVAKANSAFGDNSQALWNGKRNVPISWYDERIGPRPRYPLATIWGSVPLFESLSAIAIADPTAANRAALANFAEGPAPRTASAPAGLAASTRHRHSHSHPAKPLLKGAEAYWDATLGGYAPYPGDRGKPNVWFDDNAWWGLAFENAYRALGDPRLLNDAQAALNFLAHRGWDQSSGGFWWNTAHTPAGQHAGEPLAGGALLAALLAQDQGTAGHASTGAGDLTDAEQWLSWGDAHFAGPGGLYWRTQDDPTPTPYIAGPTVAAKQVLCQIAPQPQSYCGQAAALANAAYQRFADRLNMGPQFDTIYLHWMLAYGRQVGDGRWAGLANEMAGDAQRNAYDAATGLYPRAWDGSDITGHQASPGMLRTHAATVELFGWLAVLGP
jgi:hypothetical protein